MLEVALRAKKKNARPINSIKLVEYKGAKTSWMIPEGPWTASAKRGIHETIEITFPIARGSMQKLVFKAADRASWPQEAITLAHAIEEGWSGKVQCPWCTDERSRANQHREDLSVERDHERIIFNCWHCGKDGIIVTRQDQQRQHRHPVPKAKDEAPRQVRKAEDLPKLDADHYAFWRNRGISQETVDFCKVFAFNEMHCNGSKEKGMGFPYFDSKGQINASKFRSIESKSFTCWQAPTSFFNIDNVPLGDDLYIVEGEADVLAMKEAGLNAISVPNGAPAKLSEEGRIRPEDDKKFRYVWNAKEKIDAAKRIILCVDNDSPGEALAEELARRIGRAKCWQVKWTGGKDANDVLLALGPEGIVKQISEATPWPVAGLYDAEHFRQIVVDLYEKGVSKGALTGYAAVDELYTVSEGMLTIVTGMPSSGKSEWVDQVMVNLAKKDGWSFVICSPENPPGYHIAKLQAKTLGLPFFAGNENFNRLNRAQFDQSFQWVDEHFVFAYQDDGTMCDIDAILDRLRTAVMRYGVRGAVIDPYNYISRDPQMSETDWISEMLTKVKVFAQSHGVHVWFIAHPKKLIRNQDGSFLPPGPYDISGSAHWFNKADHGITIHRDAKNTPSEVEVHCWKCRFSWLGKQGEAKLTYDTQSQNYYDYLPPIEGGSEENETTGPIYSATKSAYPWQ